jgi:hypothetical protein
MREGACDREYAVLFWENTAMSKDRKHGRSRRAAAESCRGIKRRDLLVSGSALVATSALTQVVAARPLGQDEMPTAVKKIIVGIRKHKSAFLSLSELVTKIDVALAQGNKQAAEQLARKAVEMAQAQKTQLEKEKQEVQACAATSVKIQGIVSAVVVIVVAIVVTVFSFGAAGSQALVLVAPTLAQVAVRSCVDLLTELEKVVEKASK